MSAGWGQLNEPQTGREQLEELIREKAEFCLSTGIAPSEYDAFTELEREIFVETWNQIVSKRNR